MTAIEVMGIRTTDEVIQVTIPKGSSNQAISQILKEKRIIKFPFLFRFVAKNEEEPFNYGIFTLKPGMSYSEIFHNLQQKTDVEGAMNFTIIEGDNLYSIAKKLEKKGICTAEGFVKVANSSSFGYSFEKSIETNPLKFSRVEGYLFPDTYRVYKGQDTEEIVNVIFGNFDSKITPELYDRMNEMGMTLEQTLTLASIIQGEAGDPNEMAKVSGVFHNRIKNPTEFPKLESDVTKKYVEKVIKPNSETNNPDMNYAYNTYDGNGLPPAPVCNPGLDAIKAALYPQQSDYYFFCSDIKTRKFYYAKTLPEHVANLDKAGLR